MCDYCHNTRCVPGCPNYEQESWGTCKYCGREILEDDEYIEDGYKVLHLECLKDMIDSDPRGVLEMLGIDLIKAGE